MRRPAFFVSLVLTLILSTPLLAGDPFWVKKDYTDWNKDECRKLLESSPWVQRSDLAEAVFEPINQSVNQNITVADATNIGNQSSSRQINYIAQLRSALPIRQALARQVLLDPKYKELTPEQREQVKQQADNLVAMQFPDAVVVRVLYGSNVDSYLRQMTAYWQHQTVDTIKNSFYLISSNGTRVQPAHFAAQAGTGREFELVFPRLVDGKPLVSPTDKTLALEFFHPDIGSRSIQGQQTRRTRVGADAQAQGTDVNQAPQGTGPTNSTRIYIPFQVKELIRGGEVIY